MSCDTYFTSLSVLTAISMTSVRIASIRKISHALDLGESEDFEKFNHVLLFTVVKLRSHPRIHILVEVQTSMCEVFTVHCWDCKTSIGANIIFFHLWGGLKSPVRHGCMSAARLYNIFMQFEVFNDESNHSSPNLQAKPHEEVLRRKQQVAIRCERQLLWHHRARPYSPRSNR